MDLKKIIKKLPFSEPFSCALSSKRKVVSGFGLGVGASLLVLLLIVILLCDPFKVSVLNSMLQGFNGFTGNSSLVSLPFSFSNTAGSSRDLQRNGGGGVQGKTGKVVTEETRNFSGWVQEETGKAVTEERRNFSQKGKDQSFLSEDLKGFEKTHRGNLSGEVNNASFSSKEETIVKKSYGEKPSEGDKNESLKDVTENNQGGKDRVADKSTKGNVSNNGENVGSPDGKERVSIHEGGFFKKDKTENSNNSYGLAKRLGNYSGNCDIFYGRWVRDDEKPYYPAGSCPHIDRDFDCHLHGRPDDDFLRWRWQPNGCDIPRLNATDFLERLRGKRLVFVGDSLNRNMWESLVCILRHGVTNKKRVYEISGRKEFKTKGFYAFRYEDYNCSIDFVSAPFLVRESSFEGRNGSIETLRLDLMDRTASFYHEADVVVFNTGHWWTHEKTSKGEDYYQEGNHVHPRLKVLVAYQKALTTWARWVDKSINTNRTQVFFRGYSVTHFRGGQWNSGGQCHKETEPIFNETYLAKYPSKMRALEHVLQQMKTPVVYLNISRLTDYRKDGHPSIYRKEYMTVEERTAAEKSQDCSHWCLPGVPDTWNELLYASLLEAGRGSWRN